MFAQLSFHISVFFIRINENKYICSLQPNENSMERPRYLVFILNSIQDLGKMYICYRNVPLHAVVGFLCTVMYYWKLSSFI